MKVLHSYYLPVTLVFFLKKKALFNVFFCFRMVVNRHTQTLQLSNSGNYRTKNAKFSEYYFFYEHEHIGRISNLH